MSSLLDLSHLWTEQAPEDEPVQCRYGDLDCGSPRGWRSHWTRSPVFHPHLHTFKYRLSSSTRIRRCWFWGALGPSQCSGGVWKLSDLMKCDPSTTLTRLAPLEQCPAVRTHWSEMRVPPQNQASSTNSPAIQGYWWGAASSPPTILSLGPGSPQSPGVS